MSRKTDLSEGGQTILTIHLGCFDSSYEKVENKKKAIKNKE